MITFYFISLFERSIKSYFEESILKRALIKNLIKIKFYNPIDFKIGSRIDNRPYGGGPGMVLEALPFLKAYEKAKGRKTKIKTIFLSPSGKIWTDKLAKEYSKKYTHVIFICGRYEGIDNRVLEATKAEKISIGNFILTGGELPSAIIADSITRELNGVLGNINSLEGNRLAAPEVYTRPEVFKWKKEQYKVPSVLLSGDHKKIENYKKTQKR